VRVNAIAKHARPVDKSPGGAWLRVGFPRAWDHGTPIPAVAPGQLCADPLTGPIAITERPVLGDQIRRPIAGCEIAPCAGRYEDPAALGEADSRARALGAGWRHDAVGRLVCPACQQRSPDAWAVYPVDPLAPTPAGENRQRDGHARAGYAGGALASIASWLRDFGAGRRARPRPALLTSLAADGSGWNTLRWTPASSPARRGRRARSADHRRSSKHPGAGNPGCRAGHPRQQRHARA
jgi:hypothetical protein